MGTFSSRASGAASTTFVDLFLRACDWYAMSVKEAIEASVNRWCERWNQPPIKVKCSKAQVVNMKDLASYVARLVAQEVITPTKELEQALLSLVDLPYGGDENA